MRHIEVGRRTACNLWNPVPTAYEVSVRLRPRHLSTKGWDYPSGKPGTRGYMPRSMLIRMRGGDLPGTHLNLMAGRRHEGN